MFILMVDGEGDNQFADIFQGTRVAIPRGLNPYRVTDNILRPIVDNQVAYHTASEISFIAQGRSDADSRAQATIDSALANHIAYTNNLNGKIAAAVYLSDCVGFCPIHAQWNDAVGYAPYQPLYVSDKEMQQNGWRAPVRGSVNLWVGNPFDTTFNEGARRDDIRVMRYVLVLPAEHVRQRTGMQVEGTDRYRPGSLYQRALRNWLNVMDLNLHGSAALQGGQQGEEQIAVVCEELAPGLDPQWPNGRRTCVALQGTADAGRDSARGTPVLLGPPEPLPGGRFSAELFYTSCQFDDVHGQRWIAPLAAQQRELNDVRSDYKRWRKRSVNAPMMFSGELIDEETKYDGAGMLAVAPGAGFTPQVLTLPAQVGQQLMQEAENIRQRAFEQGGYNAASRGASNPGDSGKKVEFLSQIDDTIHGPAKTGIFASACRLIQTGHALFAQYADIPWQLKGLGLNNVESAEDWVDRTMVSQEPPEFRVDSGIGGGTPQSQANRIMQMVTTPTADHQPLMTTEEARASWPDGGLFDNDSDPKAAQRNRAKRMASMVRKLAKERRQQGTVALGPDGMTPVRQQLGTAFSDPAVQQAGLEVANHLHQQMPPLPTDDVQAVMEELGQVTQDETEDAIARHAALTRWTQHQQQLQMAQLQAQAQQAALQGGAPAQEGQSGQPQANGDQRQAVLAEIARRMGGQPPQQMAA